MVAHN